MATGHADTVGSKEGLPQFVQALEPVFGRASGRAHRCHGNDKGFRGGAGSDPFIEYVWNAANDELMCDVCAPLSRARVIPKKGGFKCSRWRCHLRTRIVDVGT